MSHSPTGVDRQVISIGARINLWGIVVMSVWLGATYLLSDPSRMRSPSFAGARDVAPLHVHGAVFVLLGLTVLAAYWRGRFLVSSLLVLGSYFLFWGGLFLYAALAYGAALTGIGPYGFIAWSCFATAQTIARIAMLGGSGRGPGNS